MITGISRFTKGEFSQAALDEVWNKGRELYKPVVAPPASGVIPMTADIIWDDSYYPPQQFPCAHNEWGYGYLNRSETPSKSFHPEENPVAGWVASNVYWEICERAIKDRSCEFSQSQSTNTWVQGHGCSYYYLREGETEWDTLFEGRAPKYGHGQDNPPDGSYKSCENQDVMDWMDEDRYKQVFFSVGGVDYYKPTGGGSFPHPWSDAIDFPPEHDVRDIVAISAQVYLRLVQIDLNLPNDFHLCEYVSYSGTDSKDAEGKNTYNIAVQGHFRSIDKSGKWAPFGVVAGIPDKATFDANPPPLAPTDGLPVF